jgi:hypothetical protein
MALEKDEIDFDRIAFPGCPVSAGVAPTRSTQCLDPRSASKPLGDSGFIAIYGFPQQAYDASAPACQAAALFPSIPIDLVPRTRYTLLRGFHNSSAHKLGRKPFHQPKAARFRKSKSS